MFKLLLVQFVVLVCFLNYIRADGYLPPYIKPCNYGTPDFSKCTKQQIEASLPLFTKGVPELGVPSVDPLILDDINVDGNGLKLQFTSAAMHGLSNSKLTDFQFDVKDEKFTLKFNANLWLTAKYIVDGQILILPIKGNGDAIIKCNNIDIEIKSKLTDYKDSKGQSHMKLVSPNYTYEIGSTTFNLKNLFNGNKQLSDATHQFANENWQQIMDEVAPPVIKQIVKTGVKAINKFFSGVTIDQIVNGYHKA